MSLKPTAEINLIALRHNLHQVKQFAAGKKIMAVIKADAYGHGILPIAKALEAADALAVARVHEGISLRQAGCTKNLVVLEGFFDQEEAKLAQQYQLELVIHQFQQIKILEQLNAQPPLNCWVKIDTGMHRLGFHPEQIDDVVSPLNATQSVQKPLRLMTHFANADDLQCSLTERQMCAFARILNRYTLESSVANSAGILAWPESHSEWVRPGLMLFGASPFPDKTAQDHHLKPVMTLKSAIIAIQKRQRGDKIGYGSTYICPQDMPIGVIAIGYGDGYPRHAKNGTPILVKGVKAQLVGRVSMDMIAVDLSDIPDAKVGDQAILWGNGLPIEEIAQAADTIPYVLMCGVTARVAINYIDS